MLQRPLGYAFVDRWTRFLSIDVVSSLAPLFVSLTLCSSLWGGRRLSLVHSVRTAPGFPPLYVRRPSFFFRVSHPFPSGVPTVTSISLDVSLSHLPSFPIRFRSVPLRPARFDSTSVSIIQTHLTSKARFRTSKEVPSGLPLRRGGPSRRPPLLRSSPYPRLSSYPLLSPPCPRRSSRYRGGGELLRRIASTCTCANASDGTCACRDAMEPMTNEGKEGVRNPKKRRVSSLETERKEGGEGTPRRVIWT